MDGVAVGEGSGGKSDAIMVGKTQSAEGEMGDTSPFTASDLGMGEVIE